jgi:hypothetical protein
LRYFLREKSDVEVLKRIQGQGQGDPVPIAEFRRGTGRPRVVTGRPDYVLECGFFKGGPTLRVGRYMARAL